MPDKEAKKRQPLVLKRPAKTFRLQERIELASSDKYNDSYECDIQARKIRERYAVSVNIINDPVTTRVYSNTWLFKDMSTCWEKFYAIADIISDIRNFVEAEGLKNMVFSFMVKHALSGIAADIENIYETNIPTVRQVLDGSTKGNLLKNFPHYPFRSQAGPDDMDAVYSSTGTAPNPIPEDGIINGVGYAIPQHLRKEKGLKDVLPCPISKFQEAAGITVGMMKGAASNRPIKTAEVEVNAPQKFIEAVKENVGKAIEFGKKEALQHYMAMTGASEPEADAFYYGVKAVCADSRIVLNLSPSALAIMLTSDCPTYDPAMETEPLLARFNRQATKREQAERAMGCYGLSPIYASVTLSSEGDKSYGKCSLILQDIKDDTVLVCGDSFGLRNPSRDDFVSDSSLVLYPYSSLEDCKTASIIKNLRKRDLVAGPAVALANILEKSIEFGKCEALIFKPVGALHISEIIADTEEMAKSIRKILMRCGKVMPVIYSARTPMVLDVSARVDVDTDNPPIKNIKQKHFEVGDRVFSKRMASQPSIGGEIIEIKNGNITIAWENEQRSIFDMNEAMWRLMPGPNPNKPKLGMVVYSLPGMDDEAVIMLFDVGIDPVSLYAIASHHHSSSPIPQTGTLERLVDSLSSVGVYGHIIKGFVPSEGNKPFEKREWVEAPLASGARLIIDVANGIVVKAGDPKDYIVAEDSANIEIE